MPSNNSAQAIDPLTERELEILRLIDAGLADRDIAERLVVTLGTVKWYNKQIYAKLGVHSRTQALVIAREQSLLDAAAGPVPGAPAARHNLPAETTSFVGREKEIADVIALLDNARLLTLTGPGGSGKTRLALQIGARLLARYEHGVYLAELASISDSQLLARTVLRAIGVQDPPGHAPELTLKSHLRARRMLLLLDNFEQIVAAAPLLSEWLAAAPGLKILVTSRELLHLYGEQEYPVPPLALPDLSRSSPPLECEAVELFVQRARGARPDFALSPENARAVAELCVHLDGLPLAIELAAARTRLFTPQAMLWHLSSRLATLVGGARDLPARLQTLRGAIQWSYDLLDEHERLLFARLGVFQGGASMEAAEAVCAPGLAGDLLAGLESLRDKSLLRHESSVDGEPRFQMLETIHEYARAVLEAGAEGTELQRRHAHCFVALAECAEPELRGAREAYWFARLRGEHENLRAALAWALAGNAATLALRMAGALRDFWYAEGDIAEGLQWTERALRQSGDAAPALRAKALNTAGWLSFARGDYAHGKLFHREALEIYRALHDPCGSAWALIFLSAHSLPFPDEWPAAIDLCEQGLALFRELNHAQGLAQALNNLGELARQAGDYERAGQAYQECLAISRQVGARQREAIMLNDLSYIALHAGDYRRAETLVKSALQLLWDLKAWYHAAIVLAELAGPLAARGDAQRAVRLLGASHACLAGMGAALPAADRSQVDPYAAAARAQLGEPAFQCAWTEGRSMSLEGAIAYALSADE